MVYGIYNYSYGWMRIYTDPGSRDYSYWGQSKPTNITGGPHIVEIAVGFILDVEVGVKLNQLNQFTHFTEGHNIVDHHKTDIHS